MITGEHGLDMLQEYQSFANSVQAKLHAATHWEKIYAGYAAALLANRERRLTFRQAAQSLGLSARDGRAVCAAFSAEALAKRPYRVVIFVEPSMQRYLGEYLDACPTDMRHLMLYSRRHGNGPSPHRSAFMDFWQERGVDIWDLRDADKK